MASVCPCPIAIHCLVYTDHIRIVVSFDDVAIYALFIGQKELG